MGEPRPLNLALRTEELLRPADVAVAIHAHGRQEAGWHEESLSALDRALPHRDVGVLYLLLFFVVIFVFRIMSDCF